MMKYCCKEMMLAIGTGELHVKDAGDRIVCKFPYNMEFRYCPYCGRSLEFGEEFKTSPLNGMNYCTSVASDPEDEVHTFVSQSSI